MTRAKLPEGPETTAPQDPDGPAGEVSRRTLLSRLAKLGIATTALTVGGMELVSYHDEAKASAKTATGIKAKHAWCMVIDLRYCDGCESCTLACQQRHDLAKDQTWLKVYAMTGADGGTFHMPRLCMMCEDPPCTYVCPVGATFRNADGLVLVGKCVTCADRLPHGELPACVSGCPMGVLYIGDLVTDVAVNGLGKTVKLSDFLKENDAVRFKEELGTNPRTWYILGHGQSI